MSLAPNKPTITEDDKCSSVEVATNSNLCRVEWVEIRRYNVLVIGVKGVVN